MRQGLFRSIESGCRQSFVSREAVGLRRDRLRLVFLLKDVNVRLRGLPEFALPENGLDIVVENPAP
ncbi:hypothetical protein [Pseudodesulfovibrio indicus]|uniref:hypothetical protein n=1 Tax=Pseudodesulfovibrio indicus TaxID=1716143 RepID=UPI0029306F51|nr:hypothetical protein [Pseudodesulfovibrio indicus]